MPSSAPGPLAADLDVLKLGGVADPVTLDDVERALHALTGWQAAQRLVDQMVNVVEAYAVGRRAGRVAPVRGHVMGVCAREHLDEHTCAAVDRCARGCRDAADELTRLGQEMEPSAGCAAPAGCVVVGGCAAITGCRVAKFEAAEGLRREVEVPPGSYLVQQVPDAVKRALNQPPVPTPAEATVAVVDAAKAARAGEKLPARPRGAPSMTPEELLAADEAALTPPQAAARAVLLAGEMRCSGCRVMKPLDGYYADRSRLVGRMKRCKECGQRVRR